MNVRVLPSHASVSFDFRQQRQIPVNVCSFHKLERDLSVMSHRLSHINLSFYVFSVNELMDFVQFNPQGSRREEHTVSAPTAAPRNHVAAHVALPVQQ